MFQFRLGDLCVDELLLNTRCFTESRGILVAAMHWKIWSLLVLIFFMNGNKSRYLGTRSLKSKFHSISTFFGQLVYYLCEGFKSW